VGRACAGAGVGREIPVSRAEGIVDIHVEGSRKLLREALVALLLLRIETHVLEKAALHVCVRRKK